MGGWVRIVAGRQNLPDDLPVFLSQALADSFRQRPQLRMRCVVPVQRDGNTVELHAWYEAHVFPAAQGSRPEGSQVKGKAHAQPGRCSTRHGQIASLGCEFTMNQEGGLQVHLEGTLTATEFKKRFDQHLTP